MISQRIARQLQDDAVSMVLENGCCREEIGQRLRLPYQAEDQLGLNPSEK